MRKSSKLLSCLISALMMNSFCYSMEKEVPRDVPAAPKKTVIDTIKKTLGFKTTQSTKKVLTPQEQVKKQEEKLTQAEQKVDAAYRPTLLNKVKTAFGFDPIKKAESKLEETKRKLKLAQGRVQVEAMRPKIMAETAAKERRKEISSYLTNIDFGIEAMKSGRSNPKSPEFLQNGLKSLRLLNSSSDLNFTDKAKLAKHQPEIIRLAEEYVEKNPNAAMTPEIARTLKELQTLQATNATKFPTQTQPFRTSIGSERMISPSPKLPTPEQAEQARRQTPEDPFRTSAGSERMVAPSPRLPTPEEAEQARRQTPEDPFRTSAGSERMVAPSPRLPTPEEAEQARRQTPEDPFRTSAGSERMVAPSPRLPTPEEAEQARRQTPEDPFRTSAGSERMVAPSPRLPTPEEAEQARRQTPEDPFRTSAGSERMVAPSPRLPTPEQAEQARKIIEEAQPLKEAANQFDPIKTPLDSGNDTLRALNTRIEELTKINPNSKEVQELINTKQALEKKLVASAIERVFTNPQKYNFDQSRRMAAAVEALKRIQSLDMVEADKFMMSIQKSQLIRAVEKLKSELAASIPQEIREFESITKAALAQPDASPATPEKELRPEDATKKLQDESRKINLNIIDPKNENLEEFERLCARANYSGLSRASFRSSGNIENIYHQFVMAAEKEQDKPTKERLIVFALALRNKANEAIAAEVKESKKAANKFITDPYNSSYQGGIDTLKGLSYQIEKLSAKSPGSQEVKELIAIRESLEAKLIAGALDRVVDHPDAYKGVDDKSRLSRATFALRTIQTMAPELRARFTEQEAKLLKSAEALKAKIEATIPRATKDALKKIEEFEALTRAPVSQAAQTL